MKRIFIFAYVAAASLFASAQVTRTAGGVTFVVDGDVTPVQSASADKHGGDAIARFLMGDYKVMDSKRKYVASSFKDDSIIYLGPDAMFKCIVKAYAEHRPLTLSPDAVWLSICQVFSQHVNDNAARLRGKIAGHDGKLSLVVRTERDLLMEDADWGTIISGFSDQIAWNTRRDISSTVTDGFSTTGPAERIASGITLMDAMKPYFEYVVVRISCGIPSITLTGTTDDWKAVKRRAKKLKGYGLDPWIKELLPILDEFVTASEGRPDARFWSGIVMQSRPDRLRGGACSPEKPTVLDGWFLTLFPYDKDCNRAVRVTNLSKMKPEMVRVPFRYLDIDASAVKETPMELWAGFIGAVEDSKTFGLTPKIGWMVRVSDSAGDTLAALNGRSLWLRVKEVPPVLRGLKRISSLRLDFTGDIVLPAWMDDITIESFTVSGKITTDSKAAVLARFPHIRIIDPAKGIELKGISAKPLTVPIPLSVGKRSPRTSSTR